jgi:hypothetical protein
MTFFEIKAMLKASKAIITACLEGLTENEVLDKFESLAIHLNVSYDILTCKKVIVIA